MMRSVDMFSGIGGMALALRGYARPILYCEIDEACRAVLSQRMRAGDIERAPVHGDARTLFVAHLEPEMVVGGFPCQDISSMGTAAGVHGRRSSLFFEIMRAIDESPTIECVFLENVANIVSCDLVAVLTALDARGFVVHWTTRSAEEHGAPHVRARWFALAHRGAGGAKCAALVSGCASSSALEAWPAEPRERCAMRPSVCADEHFDPHWARRCRMLGNALVPCVARGAFEYLARAASVIGPMALVASLFGTAFDPERPQRPESNERPERHESNESNAEAERDQRPEAQMVDESGESGESGESEEANGAEEAIGAERTESNAEAIGTEETSGTDGPNTTDDGAIGTESPNGVEETRRASLPRDATLLPGWTVCAHTARVAVAPSYASCTSIDTRVANGPDLVHVPTPRHGNVYGGPASERNLRGTLGVFLVNCEVSTARAIERGASPDVPMHKQIVPNPRYVEWMMGFPQDWTRVDVPATTPMRPSYRANRTSGSGGSSGHDGAEGTDADDGGVEGAVGTTRTTRSPRPPRPIRPNDGERVFRRNGMHVLMSDRSLGVRAASVVWRAMSLAERALYSERARCE